VRLCSSSGRSKEPLARSGSGSSPPHARVRRVGGRPEKRRSHHQGRYGVAHPRR
jgi:hypothetical protein